MPDFAVPKAAPMHPNIICTSPVSFKGATVRYRVCVLQMQCRPMYMLAVAIAPSSIDGRTMLKKGANFGENSLSPLDMMRESTVTDWVSVLIV
jgi:hypothetical protein